MEVKLEVETHCFLLCEFILFQKIQWANSIRALLWKCATEIIVNLTSERHALEFCPSFSNNTSSDVWIVICYASYYSSIVLNLKKIWMQEKRMSWNFSATWHLRGLVKKQAFFRGEFFTSKMELMQFTFPIRKKKFLIHISNTKSTLYVHFWSISEFTKNALKFERHTPVGDMKQNIYFRENCKFFTTCDDKFVFLIVISINETSWIKVTVKHKF